MDGVFASLIRAVRPDGNETRIFTAAWDRPACAWTTFYHQIKSTGWRCVASG